jgi:hypothetical protein
LSAEELRGGDSGTDYLEVEVLEFVVSGYRM